MIVATQQANPQIHESASRAARRCRRIIQAVLREEEWNDADAEFYLIIREELEQLLTRLAPASTNVRESSEH